MQMLDTQFAMVLSQRRSATPLVQSVWLQLPLDSSHFRLLQMGRTSLTQMLSQLL
jgi:hypothetical protein